MSHSYGTLVIDYISTFDRLRSPNLVSWYSGSWVVQGTNLQVNGDVSVTCLLDIAITHISSSGRAKINKLEQWYTCSRRSRNYFFVGAGCVITSWSREFNQYLYFHLYRGCGHQTWRQQLNRKSGSTHPWMLQSSFSGDKVIFLLKDGLQTPNMDSRYGTPMPLVPRCSWLNCHQLRCFDKYLSPLFEGIKVTKHEQQLQVLEWTSGAPIARCCWRHFHMVIWLCKTIIFYHRQTAVKKHTLYM